jgi:carboxyl-terminal processing protease
LHKLAVVALVNEYTASSAELLGAALQDNRRASIVGASTFGKGSVQSIVDLPGSAGLRLTTLRYYSPSGRAIQAQGIRPDVAVPSTQGDFGVVREKNLEGHLPAEPGRSAETPDVSIEMAKPEAPSPGPSLGPKDVPTDPRTGSDAALAVAYQMLTGALSTPNAR